MKKIADNLYSSVPSEKKNSLSSESQSSTYCQENFSKSNNGVSEKVSPEDKKVVSPGSQSQKSVNDSKFSQSIPLQELNQHDSKMLADYDKKYKFSTSSKTHKDSDNNNSGALESLSSAHKVDMNCHPSSSDKIVSHSSNISPEKYSKSVKSDKFDDVSNQSFVKSYLNYKFPFDSSHHLLSNEHRDSDEESLPVSKESIGQIVPTSVGQSSDSEESDDEKSAEAPLIDEYGTDDPTLENASLLNEHGLTDAEGALSDLNSIINDPGHVDGDLDDTSISSRASSRMFDSDQLLSVDSLNVMYDSEYDNYRPGMVSDDDIFHHDHASDADLDYLEDPHMENIRVLSNNITKNFGQSSRGENDDSELG